MKKIWQKGSKIEMNKKVENFLSADDVVYDKKLAVYDVYGSLGHLAGLLDAGIITDEEYKKLKNGLKIVLKKVKKGGLEIKVTDEDIHTTVEKMLKQEIGVVAGKIHSLRSRNDQVAVDLKLFSKQELLAVMKMILDLSSEFLKFANQYKTVAMPGYTHTQKAMVSSVGLWAESFAPSLLDDFELLKNAYDLNNQSPLGSAAGYGAPLPINRELVAKTLGFTKVQDNFLYCQNSRGKIELAIIHALMQVMLTVNKFASDLLMFTMGDLNYFYLPDSFLTGSSIMVQKKNYDVLEILRSKHSALAGNFQHANLLISSLPSGYNRDFQEIKKPLFSSFDIATEAISISKEVISNLKVNKEKLALAITLDLLVTNEVYRLVKEGVIFRSAYQKIGEQYHNKKLEIKIKPSVPAVSIANYSKQINSKSKLISKEQSIFNSVLRKLG